MQVTPLPVPVVPVALPQEAARTVPQIQAQAAAPLIQRAVDPSPSAEHGQQTRSNGDKAKGGGQPNTEKRGSAGGVNIRV